MFWRHIAPFSFPCSLAEPINGGCGRRPATGSSLDGLSHHESVGGCCMGSVEYWGLHLWLHSHQRHGGAHLRPWERHHYPPVCDWASVRRYTGALHLHPLQETLRMCERMVTWRRTDQRLTLVPSLVKQKSTRKIFTLRMKDWLIRADCLWKGEVVKDLRHTGILSLLRQVGESVQLSEKHKPL